ncbi:MAG: SMP-30/gluconolactonase/LRE family protein [Rhizobiaceae bacterium]
MLFLMRFLAAAVGLAFVYLLLWPVPLEPAAWEAPEDAGYNGAFEPNERMSKLTLIDLGGRAGPEDVDIGPDGLIYCATHSGEIIRMGVDGKPTVFADTEGRPLGIEFAPDGTLYVADAYRGLLAVDRGGVVTLLADTAEDGTPILYADDVDIAPNGIVYFSDASTRFSPVEHGGTLAASILDLVEHSNNGRVLAYDPNSRQATLFADNMTFPNGIAVSRSGDAVYVVETGSYRIWRYPTDGSEGSVVLDNLPGFPDNINNSDGDTFWVGLASPRNRLMDALSGQPFLRKAIMRLPDALKPAPTRYGFVLRMGPAGEVIETLQDPSGAYALTTGAASLPDGRTAITSLTEKRLGILP